MQVNSRRGLTARVVNGPSPRAQVGTQLIVGHLHQILCQGADDLGVSRRVQRLEDLAQNARWRNDNQFVECPRRARIELLRDGVSEFLFGQGLRIVPRCQRMVPR